MPTSTAVMVGTKAVRRRMRRPPTCHSETSHSGWSTGLGCPVKTTTARLSIKKDTAMALIRAEMRGASRKGR